MIAAGRKESYCRFEAPVETPAGGGSVDTDWQEQFVRWGALVIPPVRAELEAIAGGAVQAPLGAMLTVPDDPETRLVATSWRVSVESRTGVTTMWNIRKAVPSEGLGDLRFAVEANVPI